MIMTSNNAPLPGPGRELDRLVAEKIGLKYIPATKGGWPEHVEFPDKPGQFVELLDYSTSITAAWQVVEKYKLSLVRIAEDEWLCGPTGKGGHDGIYSENDGSVVVQFHDYLLATTAPHAICLAFLEIPELV
jgi:hypothetical protein